MAGTLSPTGAGGRPRLFFLNATFLFQQAEWDYWTQPAVMEQPGGEHIAECVLPLADAGHLRLVREDEVATEDLTFVPTPGHVSVGIYSAGERAIILGDASHYPAQLDHPEWSPVWDVDPRQAALTRDALFDAIAADGRTLIAGHWAYPGFGRLRRLRGRRVFQAR